MKLFFNVTLLLILSASALATFAQKEDVVRFQNTRFVAFQDFSIAEVTLLNVSFLKKAEPIGSIVEEEKLNRKLTVDQGSDPSILRISADLAEGNVLNWEMKIIDDKNAEWRNFTCDCGEGLVTRIFGIKKEAYRKTFAKISLDELGAVNVNYTENFKKDILGNANFLPPYFQETFQTYTLMDEEE